MSVVANISWFLKNSFSFLAALFTTQQLTSSVIQPANNGPQNVPRTSPSNVPRTFPKDPIWSSWGHPELTFWGNLEMTSWGRPNLTSKGHPWEVVLGRPQDVLRTFPRRPWKHVSGTRCGHLFDVPKFLFAFLSELIKLAELSEWLTKSI